MRVVFMGSAEIACAPLQALLDTPEIEVVGAITQPDRPAGRTLRTAACAAKAYAQARGIELFSPASVNHPESLEHIRQWRPDIGVVVAYGQILKRPLLALPRRGFINIHTSLLPKYRGAAPIQRAVANGDAETGVTIMQMDEGMDTGGILAQCTVPIGCEDTAGHVHDRLAAAGAALLPSVLADIQAGRMEIHPQDNAYATSAPKLAKAEGRLDWTQPATALFNRVRGFNPWPGCFFQYECGHGVQTVRVLDAWAECGGGFPSVPGSVIGIDGGPLVACGEGALRLRQVQPEGGKVMQGSAFLCGHPLHIGDRLR
jgi:methionyl-tRNA formyltransferase